MCQLYAIPISVKAGQVGLKPNLRILLSFVGRVLTRQLALICAGY